MFKACQCDTVVWYHYSVCSHGNWQGSMERVYPGHHLDLFSGTALRWWTKIVWFCLLTHNCFSFLETFSVLTLHASFILFRSDIATNYGSLTITFVCIVASICLYLALFSLEVNEYVHQGNVAKEGLYAAGGRQRPSGGTRDFGVPIQFHVHVPIKGLGTYWFCGPVTSLNYGYAIVFLKIL